MLLLFGDWQNVVDWALEFTHATKEVLYATPISPPTFRQSQTPPCLFAVVLYAMDRSWTSRMCYLPFDGGHSRKAKCQARHLGRSKPECAGKSSWLWRGMRLRSLAWPYRPWQAKIVHERPWPPVAGHGRSCFRFEIVAMTIPKSTLKSSQRRFQSRTAFALKSSQRRFQSRIVFALESSQ